MGDKYRNLCDAPVTLLPIQMLRRDTAREQYKKRVRSHTYHHRS